MRKNKIVLDSLFSNQKWNRNSNTPIVESSKGIFWLQKCSAMSTNHKHIHIIDVALCFSYPWECGFRHIENGRLPYITKMADMQYSVWLWGGVASLVGFAVGLVFNHFFSSLKLFYLLNDYGFIRSKQVEDSPPIEDIPQNIPNHIAVIMDGNRRFGRKHYNDPCRGHKWGVIKLFLRNGRKNIIFFI